MTTDQEIIDVVMKAFAFEPRSQHFTNYLHCDECAEHNDLLSSRDLQGLRLEDVNNAGWDPIWIITDEGFRYYLPSLARLALESSASIGWYLSQLLFHLIGDGPQNRRVCCCSTPQKRVITAVLWHVVETRPELIGDYEIEEELQRAIEIWSYDAA